HGEVPNDQIVSGYEYSKGQYVIVDPGELDKLRTEDEKAINIDVFIKPDDLDLMYSTGKTYYLVPDGPVGQKPYAVLHDAMVQQNRQAIAQVVMHGRDQVVLLRPVDGMLTMTLLNYDPQITKPATFEDELTKPAIAPEELNLAKMLIDASTPKQFDFAKYK